MSDIRPFRALRPRPDLAASPITLSGSPQPRSEFFSAAGVSPGALAEVRSRLRDRPLPFRVSGNLGNPGIHFDPGLADPLQQYAHGNPLFLTGVFSPSGEFFSILKRFATW